MLIAMCWEIIRNQAGKMHQNGSARAQSMVSYSVRITHNHLRVQVTIIGCVRRLRMVGNMGQLKTPPKRSIRAA